MALANLRTMVPKNMHSFLKGIRYQGWKRQILETKAMAHQRAITSILRQEDGDYQVQLSDDLELNISAESLWDFELFCGKCGRSSLEWQVFQKACIGRNMLLDIGALYGVFSLAFTLQDTSKRAIAFEPCQGSHDVMVANIARNQLQHSITAFAKVVNNGENQQQYVLSGAFLKSVSSAAHANLVQTDGIRIDDFIKESKIEPDIIKIDVEGMELEVLEGSLSTLEQYRPLVLLELHPSLLRTRGIQPHHVLQLLLECGYELSDIYGKSYSARQGIPTIITNFIAHPNSRTLTVR